jgi:hypothetical protein
MGKLWHVGATETDRRRLQATLSKTTQSDTLITVGKYGYRDAQRYSLVQTCTSSNTPRETMGSAWWLSTKWQRHQQSKRIASVPTYTKPTLTHYSLPSIIAAQDVHHQLTRRFRIPTNEYNDVSAWPRSERRHGKRWHREMKHA